MSSSTKLYKISQLSSALGISHVKNCTGPLKQLSEDYQIIHSEVLRHQAETVVCPTKGKESSGCSEPECVQEVLEKQSEIMGDKELQDYVANFGKYYR